MTETDRPAFARALFVLGETFNEPISDLRAEGYFDAMRDFSLEAANAAIRVALRTCKFFPRPVELREMVEGDADTNADQGWAEVIREVRRVGYIGVPVFTDPTALATVRDVWGSWARLCETLPGEGPELVGWMKQFKSAYRSQGVRARTDALAAGMPSDLRKQITDIAARKAMPAAPLQLVTKVGYETT
jgi:hypothetical protein